MEKVGGDWHATYWEQGTAKSQERRHSNCWVSQNIRFGTKIALFMQLTLPFPNSISNVNPSSMRWKSALENWINARNKTTLSLECALCSINWNLILTVVCPRSAQLARAWGRGGARQWPGLTARHAPGLLAQQRVEEVGQHSLTRRGGAGLHSGRVNLQMHILENTKPDLIFTTLKHLLTSVAPNQHKKCHASKVKSESGSTS